MPRLKQRCREHSCPKSDYSSEQVVVPNRRAENRRNHDPKNRNSQPLHRFTFIRPPHSPLGTKHRIRLFILITRLHRLHWYEGLKLPTQPPFLGHLAVLLRIWLRSQLFVIPLCEPVDAIRRNGFGPKASESVIRRHKIFKAPCSKLRSCVDNLSIHRLVLHFFELHEHRLKFCLLIFFICLFQRCLTFCCCLRAVSFGSDEGS
mmetsp:Transcript_36140/g.70672  ORF Transcript_36140/g.70672 Transcript_36140/m.70672 type:complete len:204 (-) Transcript_36140:741-1352(-)